VNVIRLPGLTSCMPHYGSDVSAKHGSELCVVRLRGVEPRQMAAPSSQPLCNFIGHERNMHEHQVTAEITELPAPTSSPDQQVSVSTIVTHAHCVR